MVYLGKTKVKDMFIDANPALFRLARGYRKNPTEAERVLWEYLRIFRSEGFAFRRQHPIVFFIADFYCHRIRLVIEVDGGIHSNPQINEYDDSRSGELERYGISVLRFKNEDIIKNIEQVLSQIRLTISELSSPSHSGRGG
ncbi:MAG: endonuclease domain-containing protein [Bacteroidales bacterium]